MRRELFTCRSLRAFASAMVMMFGLSAAAVPGRAEMAVIGAETERLLLLPGYARIFSLDAPASNIVVGNPNILSVSLIDPLHVLLTPTARGTGNLLFLDAEKNVVKSVRVEIGIAPATAGVTSRDVRIFRAMARSNYECSAIDCVPAGQPTAPAKN